MTSDAATVSKYLQSVPEKRMAALTRIRDICREILVVYEEFMAYRMPCCKIGDSVVVGFASQKDHISFYCTVHQVMLDNQEQLKGLDHGKGCIRFANPGKIDFDLIRKSLTAAANSDSKPG